MKVEMKVTFTIDEVEAAMKDLYVRKFGLPPEGFELFVSGDYRSIPDIRVETVKSEPTNHEETGK